MDFEIIERINKRIEIDKDESDVSVFLSLMYKGEMITKLVCAGLIAGIDEDTKKHKYSQIFHLVRTNGIGDWANSIEEILAGPTSHFLSFEMKLQQKELTQKLREGNWQYDAVKLIQNCLNEILYDDSINELATKVAGKTWFSLFATLRNKTRGHGAPNSQTISKIIGNLSNSIDLICNNFKLFKYQWAYLHQNLSGKYRISKITSDITSFKYLSSNEGKIYHYITGVYLFIDNEPKLVDLIKSDTDLSDFYFPNGGFSNKRFEVLSYITGNKDSKDISPYLLPPGELPTSQTEGTKSLEVVGNCFTNVPKLDSIYVKRKKLESEVKEILLNERHPVVTLLGRGGIGKTSLALNVLNEICFDSRFEIVLWFSSRDIDLLEEGAKSVQPQILDIDDVAKEFVRLLDKNKLDSKDFNPRKYIEDNLSKIDHGKMLIVFDNFETVKNPVDMFKWLDTHIRIPNKILITSRIREFKADYPIIVGGMEENEFSELLDNVANKLKIKHLLNPKYLGKLYEESGGHPYVAKILLGVVAKEKKAGNIERIVASEDELLTALFERTFASLTQAAKRIFLLLSSWRSTIPRIGIEAILTSSLESKFDVENALLELYSFSFIDIHKFEDQKDELISLPLSSYLFGKRKLNVSAFKQSVMEMRELLMMFGVGKLSNLEDGCKIRYKQFFVNVARKIQNKEGKKIDFYLPILQYICRGNIDSWLTYASLMEELKINKYAIEACQNFLEIEENQGKTIAIWKKLSSLHAKDNNHLGEIHSLIEMSEICSTSFASISANVNRLNLLLSEGKLNSNKEERDALVFRMIKIISSRMEFDIENFDEYTKIAWLYVHIGKIKEAKKTITRILKIEPDHRYALKLSKTIKL